MKKFILLFIFLISNLNLFAVQIKAKYNISYGNFLELGIANTTLDIKNNLYKIRIEAKTTGMAKYLSNNRVEIYESYGKVIDDKFVPHKFIKIKKDRYKKRVRTYTFNHKKKEILINDKKTGVERKISISTKDIFHDINKEENSKLDYFAKDDLLSLFFNIHKKIITYKKGKEYLLKAVGANKTKGVINILMPSAKDLKQINKILNTNDKSKFTAYINQKIFQSERGELLIALNDYGFCSKAVLKDVLLFGDIVGEMIEFKIDKG